jgi:superfamily II DNA helicase RecQ
MITHYFRYRVFAKTEKYQVDEVIALIKNKYSGKSGIVFCLSVNDTEHLAKELRVTIVTCN